MADNPRLQFLSLFVPDLDAARTRYQAVFGISPIDHDPDAPEPHPFASAGPVVFDLGGVKLALYQCDMRATHPGDVGIGVCIEEPPAHLASRARTQGANVFYGPLPLPRDNRNLTVFVMPDRHFFEVVAAGN